eukprot:101734_1
MSSKKRSFAEIFAYNDELHRVQHYPPCKKQKTCPNITEIDSNCKILDQSFLVRHLNIPCIINKEIAEYSRGEVKHCSNRKCKQPICVFNEDIQDNTSNMQYKRCPSESQIFCHDCMAFAIPAVEMTTHWSSRACGCRHVRCKGNCCSRLEFIPNCPKCDLCHQPLPNRCGCHPGNRYLKCYNCHSTACFKCLGVQFGRAPSCVSCREYICSCCTAYTDTETGSVCLNCHVDKMIECSECNTVYPLLYETNRLLYNKPLSVKMEKCSLDYCDVFVCFVCKGRHAYCVSNDNGDCVRKTGTFCTEHLPPKCWRTQTLDEQPEISFDRALQILLNEGRSVDVFDFAHKRWRPSKYLRHWDHTRKIMISYTDLRGDRSHMDKFKTLVFPSVCIRLSQ